jgi:ATP/maltotriose-dependent transcriptional regulator MalT
VAVPLLKTKLYILPVRLGECVVSRPRLFERLGQGIRLGCKLTLVSAPAGFGKTTLVSEWVQRTDEPTAWLSPTGHRNPNHPPNHTPLVMTDHAGGGYTVCAQSIRWHSLSV